MKLALVILGFPIILVFLMTIGMVRSAQQRYERRQIDRGEVLGYLAFAAALWGGVALLGGALMSGFGVGWVSPWRLLAVGLIVAGVVFARLSKGVLWGKP